MSMTTDSNYIIASFEVGQAYECREESSPVRRFMVTRRTARNVWIQDVGTDTNPHGMVVRRRVYNGHDDEVCYPDGAALGPLLRASTPVGSLN